MPRLVHPACSSTHLCRSTLCRRRRRVSWRRPRLGSRSAAHRSRMCTLTDDMDRVVGLARGTRSATTTATGASACRSARARVSCPRTRRPRWPVPPMQLMPRHEPSITLSNILPFIFYAHLSTLLQRSCTAILRHEAFSSHTYFIPLPCPLSTRLPCLSPCDHPPIFSCDQPGALRSPFVSPTLYRPRALPAP